MGCIRTRGGGKSKPHAASQQEPNPPTSMVTAMRSMRRANQLKHRCPVKRHLPCTCRSPRKEARTQAWPPNARMVARPLLADTMPAMTGEREEASKRLRSREASR